MSFMTSRVGTALGRVIADRCTDPCDGLDFMSFDLPVWLALIPIGLIVVAVVAVTALIRIGRRELDRQRHSDDDSPT